MYGAVANICQHTFLPILDQTSVVFDFGANEGEFGHAVIKRFGSRVFSAEPVPHLFNSIGKHANLSVLPVAIGGECSSVPINVYESRCASVLGAAHDNEASQTLMVECVTFAEFKRRTGVERIHLLKVDIEGAELSLFKSMTAEELQAIDQITVEFHDFIYPDIHDKVEEIKRDLGLLGFFVVPFSLDNTDVLFINRKAGISRAEILWLRTAVKYWRGVGRRVGRMSNLGHRT
jgi:FkbM family methyltransferase